MAGPMPPGNEPMESASSLTLSSSSLCGRSGNLAIRALIAERYRWDIPRKYL